MSDIETIRKLMTKKEAKEYLEDKKREIEFGGVCSTRFRFKDLEKYINEK